MLAQTILKKQAGLSIIEMLVGVTVGLIVLSGAFTLYLHNLNSARDVSLLTRLNNDTSAIMNLIVRDLKRSGYCSTPSMFECRSTALYSAPATTVSSPSSADVTLKAKFPAVNAFIVRYGTNNRAVYPFESLVSFGSGCALYAYDTPPTGGTAVGNSGQLDRNTALAGGSILDERHGFWLDNNEVKVFTGSTSSSSILSHTCATSAAWQSLTDRNAITVTVLNFTFTAASMSTATVSGVVYNSYSPAKVDITLTACATLSKYASQTDVARCGSSTERFSQTITETVYLPNIPESQP